MRLTDASSELSSFSALLKQETNKNARSKSSWISRTAVATAEAMLEACPSVYERRCLLELLSAVDFCDSGIAALKFRRLLRKLQLVEPSLCAGKETVVNGPSLGKPHAVLVWSSVFFDFTDHSIAMRLLPCVNYAAFIHVCDSLILFSRFDASACCKQEFIFLA